MVWYVLLYVLMYVLMHVLLYALMYVSMCVCVRLTYMHTYIHTHIYICELLICLCIRLFTYQCVYLDTYMHFAGEVLSCSSYMRRVSASSKAFGLQESCLKDACHSEQTQQLRHPLLASS